VRRFIYHYEKLIICFPIILKGSGVLFVIFVVFSISHIKDQEVIQLPLNVFAAILIAV
jgi:hypothetical protein